MILLWYVLFLFDFQSESLLILKKRLIPGAYDGLLLVQRIITINTILSNPFLLSTLYIYGVMAIVLN